jgi:hypothetical protein
LLTKEIHLSVHPFIKTRAFSVVRTSGVAAFPTATDLPPNPTLSGSLAAFFMEHEFEVQELISKEMELQPRTTHATKTASSEIG